MGKSLRPCLCHVARGGNNPRVGFEPVGLCHCFKKFFHDRDYWDCVVRAVALAAKKRPFHLEGTYQAAHNHIAYHMK
jgi:hypothetical protein